MKMAGGTNFLSVTDLTTRVFHAATQKNVAAIEWAKLHGLLAANLVSPTCFRARPGTPRVMSLVGGVARRAIRHCLSDLGSFFEGSHISIQSVFHVIRYWPFEEFSFRKASRELAMAEHTFIDFVRDICAEHFLQNPVRIRGVGVEVQIDESVRPQKTHR